ncbi:MAG: hypothetical protein ABEI96_02020 [Haloarculaceae archaeon]
MSANAIENDGFDEKTFFINQTSDSYELEISPNCNNDNNPKVFQYWQIIEEGYTSSASNEHKAALYLPMGRSVDDAGDSDALHVLHNVRECGEGSFNGTTKKAYSVNVKPATPRGNGPP